MDAQSPIRTHEWHIPRPSLATSAPSSVSDARSRGGSASSQGSSSNHSTHSASSGSQLLSAAQLVRMNNRSEPIEHEFHPNGAINYGRKSGLSNAVVSIPEESREMTDTFWQDVKRGSDPRQDTTSIASSTHFTVVNGFTKHRSSKEAKSCCCNHSHQITVLVISMTILFSACILAAICFVEMRMRKETGMYKYS